MYRVEFKPHGPVSFRKPSDFTARAHGPGVAGESLGYPMPSTLAGALAAAAYLSGTCSPGGSQGASGGGGCGEWRDTVECLQAVLGGGFKLYAGLAKLEGEDGIRYYTTGGYATGDALKEYYKCMEGGNRGCAEKLEDAVREPRQWRVGIALQRHSKTVRTEHLYTVTMLDPAVLGLSYILVAEAQGDPSSLNGSVVRLGGEGRTATLKVAREEKEEDSKSWAGKNLVIGGEGCNEWVIHLASPALLHEPPWPSGAPVVLDESSAKQLAVKLVPKNVNANVKGLTVPRGEPTVTVLAPGWSMAEGRPRRPHLYIPPGTTIRLEAGRGDVASIVERGLGEHTELGWGTAVAVCIG